MPSPLLILLAATLSLSVNAADTELEQLAGIEASLNTNTTMTVSDLDKTQNILASQPTGAANSWYNIDTTTHYNIIIGQHFTFDLRPCVNYTLITKHDSETETQHLNACMNYTNQWIAQLDKAVL